MDWLFCLDENSSRWNFSCWEKTARAVAYHQSKYRNPKDSPDVTAKTVAEVVRQDSVGQIQPSTGRWVLTANREVRKAHAVQIAMSSPVRKCKNESQRK